MRFALARYAPRPRRASGDRPRAGPATAVHSFSLALGLGFEPVLGLLERGLFQLEGLVQA